MKHELSSTCGLEVVKALKKALKKAKRDLAEARLREDLREGNW